MRIKPTTKIIKTGPCASFLFVCFLLISGLLGCVDKAQPVVFTGATMGTSYHIKLINGDTPIPSDLGERIGARLQELDNKFTTYQDNSELMQFNQSQLNQSHVVSVDMRAVLRIAKKVFNLSGGAFDPTIAPLVNLWGFGPSYTGDVVPQSVDISELLSSVGFNYLVFDEQSGTVSRDADIQLDLSAVAKGYAVDAIAALLDSHGYQNYMVEVGGELRVNGRKENDQLWRIAIEKPSIHQSGVQYALSLENIAVATSGDYRNYFESEGKRYSHTIDPRTGYPIEHNLASVTVLADTTAMADALATAMMVMGPESAMKLAEQQKLAVYLLVKEGDDFKPLSSAMFTQYLSGE